MAGLDFDYGSTRARKARFFARNGKTLDLLAEILAGILAISGAAVLGIGVAAGWTILFLSAWPLMLHFWVARDLRPLNAEKNPATLDAILAGDLLGHLPQNPTPDDLARAVTETNGGRFFFARFGVSAQYLPDLASKDPAETAAIFSRAREIHASLQERSDVLSAATVTAALIVTEPRIRETLNVLHLDESDILSGAEWFSHLSHLIELYSEPMKTGGIARDWSFGYIPTLEQFGANISEKYSHSRSLNTKLEAHEALVGRMLDVLSGGDRTNAALVGEAGVGKETVVEALAERLMDGNAKVPGNLRFNQIFQLDASALISAASGRGQIENLANRLFNEVFHAKNIILFLNHAELFFADGTGAVDISNLLQPILSGGAIRVILALDQQPFLQISEQKPALAADLNRLDVAPTDQRDTVRILQDQIISLEFSKKVTFMYQSLTEAFRLSERYVNSVEQPLKSVQLIKSAQNFAQNGLVTAQSVVAAIEQTTGVKVAGNLDEGGDEEREKLLNLENLIHERMIDQAPAVSAVASAIRRARAGVRNEKRPIGTFLFLGPTGVGKTELAKSLAAVYFGDEKRLVSIDLNEYVQPEDVQRLIADGASNPNSLTAQVMKNPFSVVLLDEIEKAHPNVLTALLQVLDEGVMKDINNKSVSFRDTILIATSNAGADRIRQYIEAGYRVEQFAKNIQDELVNSRQFAPEFLNRFDDIIVFKPLSKSDLLQVIDLIIADVNRTLAVQKVSVAVDENAKLLLVNAGYDPRLGARPMRRVVQRTIENIVAQKMLTRELVAGSGLKITEADIAQSGGLEATVAQNGFGGADNFGGNPPAVPASFSPNPQNFAGPQSSQNPQNPARVQPQNSPFFASQNVSAGAQNSSFSQNSANSFARNPQSISSQNSQSNSPQNLAQTPRFSRSQNLPAPNFATPGEHTAPNPSQNLPPIPPRT